MLFRKTEEAKYTIVYSEGKRIAHFVKGEFETKDKKAIKVLADMGYQMVDTPKLDTFRIPEED